MKFSFQSLLPRLPNLTYPVSDQLAEFVIFFVGRSKEDGMLNDVGVGLQAAGGVAQLDVDRLPEEVVGHLTNLAKRWGSGRIESDSFTRPVGQKRVFCFTNIKCTFEAPPKSNLHIAVSHINSLRLLIRRIIYPAEVINRPLSI